MFAEFVKHKERVRLAREQGKDDPILPDYIGLCFMKIANNLAKKGNFSGYSYIDEMIGDGIENCIMAANNFAVDQKQKNPFGYFSRIVFRAFLRRIEKEKKQNYLKYKSLQNAMISGDLYNGNSEDFMGMSVSMDDTYMNNVVSNFESSRDKKVKKERTPIKKKGVEVLFADESTEKLDRGEDGQ
jgi:hypothetical protein